MHLTVLSRSAAIFTTRRIVEAARARGHVARVVDPLLVEMRLGTDGPEIFHRGRAFPATDVVVPRIAPSISQYGLAVVNHLQLLGLPVLNGAPAIGLARNKMRVLQLLSASGVQVPRTVMASEPSGLRDMARHVGGLPVLVKLLRGNEKTGVIVCETRQALESALEAILRLGQNTMVQQYVKGRRGGDLRVFVVGGRAVAALRRRPRVGRLSRSLGQGARFEGARLGGESERAAVAAARVVGLEVCAVDMLDAPGGPRVFEVHSSPGIREAEEACGVDVAGAIVERAAELAGQPSVAGKRRFARGPRRKRD
jgi:ribosomal protein S6--L-glutamate ligase